MVDLNLKGNCRNCRYWDQRYPQNKQLGVCRVMGLHLCNDNEVAINLSGSRYYQADSLPFSDVAAVRTQAGFGCIAHDPRRDEPTP